VKQTFCASSWLITEINEKESFNPCNPLQAKSLIQDVDVFVLDDDD